MVWYLVRKRKCQEQWVRQFHQRGWQNVELQLLKLQQEMFQVLCLILLIVLHLKFFLIYYPNL